MYNSIYQTTAQQLHGRGPSSVAEQLCWGQNAGYRSVPGACSDLPVPLSVPDRCQNGGRSGGASSLRKAVDRSDRSSGRYYRPACSLQLLAVDVSGIGMNRQPYRTYAKIEFPTGSPQKGSPG